MKLSRSTRREPTQTKTLQNEYVKAVRKLFITYKKGILSTFESNATQLSVVLDIIGFDSVVRQYGTQLVTDGAPITEEFARKSFTSGTVFGNTALKRIGVEGVIGTGLADWRVIDALKVRNLTALRGITDETNKQIIRELTDGMQLGESIPKLRDRIAGRIDHIGKTRATVMARTETINAFTQGAELRYAQAGIEKLEILTAADDRVCDICWPLNGTVFDIKSRHERPPLHPNCRCTIIPVLE